MTTPTADAAPTHASAAASGLRPTVRESVELAALAGVWRRHLTLFRRFWPSTTVSATVDPTVQLLAMGLGIGSLVSVVSGRPYIQFLATGLVAATVLFTAMMPSMYETFVLRQFLKIYDGVMAAPISVAELVVAEATWTAAKAGVYCGTPVLIALAFGLPPSWGMLLVPFVGALASLGFALLGIWISTLVPAFDTFSYVNSGVITPLFLVSGTFFPLEQLPPWARWLSELNPLRHCVQLVRDAVFGFDPLVDLVHVGALALCAALTCTRASRGMRRKLID